MNETITIIRNGRLIDPGSGTDGMYDLILKNGKVAEIVPGKGGSSAVANDNPEATVIDATGKIVCPGFIDMHMHEDPLTDEGKPDICIFDCMLGMGVTTAIAGNCGDNFCDPVKYLDAIDRYGAPVNVAMLAGHSYFRKKAGAADKYTAATASQRETITRGIRDAIAGGCLGLSFGVRYVPGTDEPELLAAAKALEGSDKMIAAHVRDDADCIFESIEEVVRLGQAFHLPVQISHIGSMGGFGQMQQVLSMIENYNRSGTDVAMDCYPYEAFSTEIGATTYDDGWLNRYHCDYSVLEFCEGPYKGQRATPETFAYMRQNEPDALTVCYVMKGSDVRMALKHPLVCLGSDGVLNDGQGHPRAAGAFPRFLSEYVKKGDISLSEGIAKMTVFAADRLKLSGKGRLCVGSDADIVIFDYDQIRDRATFDSPILPPEGIEYVLIGGQIALQKGRIKNHALGRSVRR